ncbi:MFS transporter [Pseudomonas asiatica]|uniref:MFS transporter n=1 Tax=Pseudomonas asiatica TaxID=2219225 RepID=UPI00383AB441
MNALVKKSAYLRRIQWLAMTLLLMAGLVNYIDRSALSMANTAIRGELGLTPTEMGWLLSAFSLAYAFSQLPVGPLLDRLGNRLILGAGICVWSLVQLGCGLVNSFGQFVFARALLGVGESPLFPAGAKVITEWFAVRERGAPTGLFIASSCLGPCIAPPLLTAIMLAFGWRWMFILTGVAGLLIGIGWFATYRNRSERKLSPEDEAYLFDAQAEAAAAEQQHRPNWRRLFAYRSTWGMVLGYACVVYMVWLYLTWLPAYLEHDRGVSVAHTGWLVALPYLFGAIGMISAGQIADFFARRQAPLLTSRKMTVGLGLLGAALTTIPAAYTADLTWAMVLICLAMFFINLASAACWTMVGVITPRQLVGSVASIQNFGGYLGGSFAPVITGWIVQTSGHYEQALVASGVIAVLGAAIYTLMVKQPIGIELAADATSPAHMTEH